MHNSLCDAEDGTRAVHTGTEAIAYIRPLLLKQEYFIEISSFSRFFMKHVYSQVVHDKGVAAKSISVLKLYLVFPFY